MNKEDWIIICSLFVFLLAFIVVQTNQIENKIVGAIFVAQENGCESVSEF